MFCGGGALVIRSDVAGAGEDGFLEGLTSQALSSKPLSFCGGGGASDSAETDPCLSLPT